MSHFYQCDNCGQKLKKWQGQCFNCHEYNSIQEIKKANAQKINILEFSKNQNHEMIRYLFKNNEINNLFGSGICSGSVSLISGEPGVGKTTILLKLVTELENDQLKILYINSEEGTNQLSNKIKNNKENLYIAHTTDIDQIINIAKKFNVIVIDSIQTVISQNIMGTPGSISQVKSAVFKLVEIAKNKNITIIIVGHINKSGDIAGPKILEHMVDTVFYITHQNDDLKLIKCHKNRFGNIQEILLIEMINQNVQVINNPETFLIDQTYNCGGLITPHLEGNRVILCELEVLTTRTLIGNPKRVVNGIKINKLNLILAVLEKYNKISSINRDVYVNVRHNFKIVDDASDLSIGMAIIANILDKELPNKVAFIGEISLNGNINTVRQVEKYITILVKYGFKTVYLSKNSKIKNSSIEIKKVKNLKEIINDVFKGKNNENI